jgi:transcriptional regulator with XRE-family HTH domain
MTSTTTPATGGTPTTHNRSTYANHGCRCQWCRHAEASYQASRSRLKAYGRWQHDVPTEPVRTHVQALNDAGLTWAQIANRAGVGVGTVRALLIGVAGREPSKNIRQASARRLLAVPLPDDIDPAGRALLDATGTLRRLRALTAAGWPLTRLARHCDIPHRHLIHMLHGRLRQVSPHTALTIRRLYDDLWNRDPRADGARWYDVEQARKLAASKGWAPALAWDDDEIDNPDARPDWTARCGTPGGYYDHSTIGTPTCQPCRDAVRAAAAERKLRRRNRTTH